MNNKIRQAAELVASIDRAIEYGPPELGVAGRLDSSGNLETDPTTSLQPGFQWVRIGTADPRSQRAAIACATKSIYGAGTVVKTAINRTTRQREIIGLPTAEAIAQFGNSAGAVEAGIAGKYTGVLVKPNDIMDLQVLPDSNLGGLWVRVSGGFYPGGYFQGNVAQLTPTATSGAKSLVCIGIDRDGAIVQELTADVALAYALSAQDAAATIADNPDTTWLVGIGLHNGDTSINLASRTLVNLAPTKVGHVKNNLSASAAPTVDDDADSGYSIGSLWIDTTNDDVHQCADATAGAAVWIHLNASLTSANGSICLYHADGSTPETFTANSAGLDAASAAASAGDVIWLPPCSIADAHMLTADVEYAGAGREQTILTGQLTLAANTVVRNLSVVRSASSSSEVIGLLMDTDAATARVYACTVTAVNSGSGAAYAVQGADGSLDLHECVVSATATGDAYGTYATAGAITMYGGQRSGSTADGQVGSVTPTVPPGGDPAYFANNGTNQAIFPNIISPAAYTYNGVTYVVWLGVSFGTYIDAYDHAARTWNGAVLVRSNPGSFDDHSTPSVMVDDDGYIHVFFGGNATATIPMYHSRSNSPEDISAWTNQSNISAATTYHGVVKTSDGTIFVFFTRKPSGSQLNHYYVRSDESYATVRLAHTSGAAGDSIYFGNPVYDEARNRIWLMWSYYEISLTMRRYLFVAYLDLDDGHWYGGMDNADLGTDTTTAEWVASCQLLSSSYETNHPNLFLDGDGNLHIQYNVKDAGVWKHAYRKWDGSSWGSIELITTANHQFNMGDIYVNSDGTVDAYLSVNASAVRGGDLEHWQRSTGGAWSKIRTIFAKATYATHDGVMFPQVNRTDASGTVRVVFADDENTPTSNDLLVYAVDANDAYVIDNPGASISLSAVATTPTASDVPLAGDRAAYDTINYPNLHRVSGDDLHLPVPAAANKTLVSVASGGGYGWDVSDVLASITVREDGVTEGTAVTFDFTGSAVSVSIAGSVATITIAPTTRWEPLCYDGALVFYEGDVVMVEVSI